MGEAAQVYFTRRDYAWIVTNNSDVVPMELWRHHHACGVAPDRPSGTATLDTTTPCTMSSPTPARWSSQAPVPGRTWCSPAKGMDLLPLRHEKQKQPPSLLLGAKCAVLCVSEMGALLQGLPQAISQDTSLQH